MKPLADHWLEIRAGTDKDGTEWREADVHHPPDCPIELYTIDLDGREIHNYTCQVGALEDWGGLEELLRSPLYLRARDGTSRPFGDGALGDVPGWYKVEAWTEISGPPNVVHDAGLEIVAGPYPGPPGTIQYELHQVAMLVVWPIADLVLTLHERWQKRRTRRSR